MKDLMIKGIRIDHSVLPQDSYVQKIKPIASLQQLEFHSPVTFFTGENGSGKSTLLEAMAICDRFNPEGGTRNYAFSTNDSHSELWQAMTLIKGSRKSLHGYFLRAESFYNVASAEEIYSRDTREGPKYYHRRSHGESFLAVLEDNFSKNGIYYLDEPEAALSPQRQMTLLSHIYDYAGQGAQFFIATHSPILLSCPDAEILSFDDIIQSKRYEETDSYRITKMFTDNTRYILEKLLHENEGDNTDEE